MIETVLPDLPRQLKRREADFGIQLRRWIEKHPLPASGPLELKQSTLNSIPFSCIEPQQIAWLKGAKSAKGVLIRNMGGSGEPDYSYYRNAPAWVVIRYPSSFHVIDIEAFLMEKERSGRKSLTYLRAKAISTWDVEY